MLWTWYVEETGRYWSSADRAYRDAAPEKFTPIATEADLRAVLAHAGSEDRAPGYDFRSDLAQKIDDAAERVRLRSITPGFGMALTYQEKKDQAVAVLAMGEAAANALASHGAAEFPTLSASVPIEAESLYAAARLVMQRYEAWTARSRSIELTRLAGKKAVREAPDAASARAAYEAIQWTV